MVGLGEDSLGRASLRRRQRGGRLVAAAGTHAIGRSARIAVVGNVLTHADFRGRGYAKAVTSAARQEGVPAAEAREVRIAPGRGIEGRVGGRRIAVGSTRNFGYHIGELVPVTIVISADKNVMVNIEALKRKAGIIVAQGELREFPNFPLEKFTVKFITMKSARGHSYRACELALEQIASKRFPLELVTTHRFGLKDVDLAIRSVGGKGVPDVIHASLMPWE